MMEERLKIIDNIKTAMMLLVVFYHACMFFTGSWFDVVSPVYDAKYMAVFAEYLNTLHVQTFTMASGFLFYVLKKEEGRYCTDFQTDARKRAKRLLIPYAATIVFWVLPFYIAYHGFNIRQIIYKYVLGCAPSQLWFLPMLFWLFIVAYIVFAKHKPNKTGLCASILISMGGYVLNKIGFINILQLETAVSYAMFYYLGAYLYEKKVKINVGKVAGCAVISIMGFILSHALIGNGSMLIKLVRLLASNSCSLAGVLMVYGIGDLFGCNAARSALWNKLRQNSFGIYLFHQQLIYPCIMLLNGRVYPVVQVLISFVIAICGASVIAELLRKFKETKIMFGV